MHIHKIHYCVFWKKNRRDSLLNGTEEAHKNFKYAKKNTNENNIKQRFHYRFRKHETMNQIQNVFVFDLESHNYQEFAESYAAGLNVVNRLRDR